MVHFAAKQNVYSITKYIPADLIRWTFMIGIHQSKKFNLTDTKDFQSLILRNKFKIHAD